MPLNKETNQPTNQQSVNQRKPKDGQILGPCPRTKKAVEYEGDGNINL